MSIQYDFHKSLVDVKAYAHCYVEQHKSLRSQGTDFTTTILATAACDTAGHQY
jgi:hypothetical protein